jgi:uncharacterized alpha-E superfamily protein
MLSRIGNSLFWLGRYLERAEHIARYTRVQYVSSVDAPLGQNKEVVLESILDMAGYRSGYAQAQSQTSQAQEEQLDEEELIYYTAISEDNPYSILAYINMVRENARGARDSISIELWEAINRFYHKVNQYTAATLQEEGIESFSRKIEENSYVIKGYIDNSLLRNEVWKLISLGIHLERTVQVCKILQTKLKDLEKLDSSLMGGALENYQWTTTLESTEAFDMYMRCHRTSPTRTHVLDFLLFDKDFPKSLAYSLDCVKLCIDGITFQSAERKKESLSFKAGKLASLFQYYTMEELGENKISAFLKSTLTSMYELAHLLDVKYLKSN